ncbi:hypothetical protein ACFSC4_03735 [Deinococcus malanensis]|uniref:hypothetical protein n=1 Tax=Deinococcus malanensis TaxID=1706855 RepID=UPI00362D4BAA
MTATEGPWWSEAGFQNLQCGWSSHTFHDLREEGLAAPPAGANVCCLTSATPELLLVIRAAAAAGSFPDPQVAHHVRQSGKR